MTRVRMYALINVTVSVLALFDREETRGTWKNSDKHTKRENAEMEREIDGRSEKDRKIERANGKEKEREDFAHFKFLLRMIREKGERERERERQRERERERERERGYARRRLNLGRTEKQYTHRQTQIEIGRKRERELASRSRLPVLFLTR